MKKSLFLSLVSVFTVFNLCKAGPLRHLQKRAAFYIANETACVVDNIVYSSGDPIPTDDPCEACKCRPPGFACVLKACTIKPGCRAVRHVGECCPEYICGCEHDGRFYQDGDEIKDPKNPCYQCYCQGSSIACAFVDCIYRDECDSVFVPGECCPQYTNCSRDIPDRNLFLGGNPLPPANLLPDEFVLPEILPIDQAVKFPENPINPIQPQEFNSDDKKELSSESSESEGVSSETKTTEPESFVTESKSSNTEVENKVTEPSESFEEVKEDIPKENENKEAIESAEEINVLLNSESNIHKDDVTENLEEQDLKLSTEPEKELPQTTTAGSKLEIIDEEKVTVSPSESDSTTTEITEKDPEIKNSASENGKSLKLPDNDHSEEAENEKQDIKSDLKTHEEKITEPVPESTSVVPTDDLKESTPIESKSDSEENVAEESQSNSQDTPLNINNAKVKSETATIIVHVKESAKIPTETDFVAETVSPVSITNSTEKNLLKTNEKIISITSNKETFDVEDNKTTNPNFEIFPTTKQINEIEPTSKTPSKDQISDNIQGRSDEADNMALEAEENPVSKEKVSDLKMEDDTSVKATTAVDAAEVDNEVRSEEITEETKKIEPTITVIREDASKPIIIEIIIDSTSSPKLEESTTELENKKVELFEVSKNEKTEELIEESKKEKTEKLTEDPKNETTEEIIKEAVPEAREESSTSEEKAERTTASQSEEQTAEITEEDKQEDKLESTTEKEVSIQEEKVQAVTPKNIEEKPEIRTNDEEDTEKNKEKTNTERVEEKTTKEIKSETTKEIKSETATESQSQTTEESKQTTQSDNQ